MSKARDLADFVSAGSPLADGTISVSEVSGAAPTASPTFTGDLTVDTNTLHVDSTNNRVGIGTASPSVVLDARLGTTTGKVAELHNSVGYGIGFTVESDGGVNTINAESNQALAFATNGASNERMRIDSSGNVGIGTSTAPSGSSATSRFITVAGSGDGVLQLTKNGSGGGAIASASGTGMLFYTHTGTVGSETYSERFRIGTSGELGIGGATYGTSGQVLTSGGSGAAPTWTTISAGAPFSGFGS